MLLPLMLLFVGCNYFGYDSGWRDGDVDYSDIQAKLTKSDYLFVMSLSSLTGYVGVFKGDELTDKYGVPYSLRQQTNRICRLKINNGIKTFYLADFRAIAGIWDLWIVDIPKD
jgi:hypothetical protein